MNDFPDDLLVTFKLRAGILVAIYRKIKSPITLEQAMAIVRQRLAFQKGGAHPVLIICPSLIRFEKDAARYAEGAEAMEGIKAAAIVLNNWLMMKAAKIYISKNSAAPIEAFFRPDAALDWLHAECGIAGGAGMTEGWLGEIEELKALLTRHKKPTKPKLSTLTQPASQPPLTAREWQIARLIAQGKTSQEIADLLDIDLSTVKKHQQHINQKLKVKNAVELLHWLIDNNLL